MTPIFRRVLSPKIYFLTIFLVILPIHISYQKDLGFFFDRQPVGMVVDTFSIPVGFFWMLMLTVYLSIWRRAQVILVTMVIFIYLSILTLLDAISFRIIANGLSVIYFLLCFELFKKIFTSGGSCNGNNGWSIYLIWFTLVIAFYFLGHHVGVYVYDFSQYTGPLLASFVIGLFFLQKTSLFSRVVLSLCFYLFMQTVMRSADSTYVEMSLLIAIMFYIIFWCLKYFGLKISLISYFLFFFINMSYIFFLSLPFDISFKNDRDNILSQFVESPELIVFAFLDSGVTNYYSFHSFLFEGFRSFGLFFLIIGFFMVRCLINVYNIRGTVIAIHAFIVLGLFSIPQMHLYTIPLIVLAPFLRWERLSFRVKY